MMRKRPILPPIREGRATLPDGVDVRPIPGVPHYLASRDGRIYSDTDPPLEMARHITGKNNKGSMRCRVKLSASGRVRPYYVSALMLEAWHGARPQGTVGQHYDGDRLNCHADNLFWGYPQSRIDPVEFVRVWQTASSLREVAERMGMMDQSARLIAARLRDHGVALRDIEIRHATPEDYATLAELARRIAAEPRAPGG